MPRRSLILLAAAAVAAAVGVASVPAEARTTQPASRTTAFAAGSPGGQAYTMTTSTLAVKDGPDGTHAVTLAYNLFVPASASAAHPAPVLIATNGFGLTKDANELNALSSFFASHGYIFLAWTAQGFGTSGGCVHNDSVDYDSKDASAFLDLLQARPDTAKDAKGVMAGIIGGSLGGGLDATTAEVEPRLRAIVPSRTWNSLTYALAPNNVVLPGDATGFRHEGQTMTVFKQQWTSLFFAVGNAGPAMGAGMCPQDKLAAGQAADAACPGYPLEICQTYADVTANSEPDAQTIATLARSSSGAFLDKLTVPTLLTQGESDTLFNLNDAMATYSALKTRGVPVGLLWNSGGHGGYNSMPGEGEEYDGVARLPAELDHETIPLAQLAWFDKYLRGMDVPVVGFSWFRDYVTNAATATGASAYGTAASLPVMGATTYALSGTADLTTGAPTAGAPNFLAPAGGMPAAYSETANFTGPDNGSMSLQAVAPTEQPGQSVAFTSKPFAVDTESVGFASAHLHLTHVNPLADVLFFGKVYDVASDGTATLIHRLVAPVRVTDAAAAAGAVDLKLLGFAHLFPAGHSVRLLLASTDASYKVPGLADDITVVTGGTDPSTFSLPQRAFVAPAAPVAPVVLASPTFPAPKASPAAVAPTAAVRPAASASPRAVRRPVVPIPGNRGSTVVAGGATTPSRMLAFTGLGVGLPIMALLLLTGALLLRRRPSGR